MIDNLQDLSCSYSLSHTQNSQMPLNLVQRSYKPSVFETRKKMADLRNSNKLVYIFKILMLLAAPQTQQVLGNLYKVGDLDAWGIPTSAKPNVYASWPKNHNFKIGDSLLFLYPPSQDSVIQVTEASFKTCTLEDPIMFMDNGNSLFNVTSNGTFYFTSGESGHCEKLQKLRIAIGEGVDSAPDDGPSDAASPSYQPAFGTIPSPASSAGSSFMSLTYLAAVSSFLAFVSAIVP